MRCVLFGPGWSGRRFMAAIEATQGVTLVGVVSRVANSGSPDLPRVDAASALTDSNVDAVLICTPPTTHVELARLAISAGKHVIVEKPVGLNAHEVAGLARLASRARRVCMVPYHFRFVEAYRKLVQLARAGQLGELRQGYHRMYVSRRRSRWLRDQDLSGGVIYETLVHGIDLFQWIVGTPVSVTARAGRVADGVMDAATIVLESSSGLLFTIDGSWLLDGDIPFGKLELLGSSGFAHIDRGTFHERHYRLTARWRDPDGTHELDRASYDDDIGLCGLVGEFARAIKREADSPAPNLWTSHLVSTVAEAALTSIASSRTVPFDITTSTFRQRPGAERTF